MDNSIYFFAAYGAAWAVIFIYLFGLFRSQKSLESRLDKIEKALRRNEDFDGGNP